MTQAGTDFERLVADFCKRNWNSDEVQTNRSVDGREMDVIIDTKSELVLIECTTERTKKKAEQDIGKIRSARRSLLGDLQKQVSGYFVTQGEPTPEIHQVAADNGSWIEACSFPSFINRFNCSSRYLLERRKRPFGSVRHPADDSIHLARNQYVQVPFRNIDTKTETSLESIVEEIKQKKRTRFVVTGDFGVGKSMTYRELFFRLSEQYEAGETYRFPIYINLNDAAFDENDDVVDLLERHAKWVGLRADRDKLVHAWTSDCCILILDGFDELIRAGFTRLTTSSRDIRYASAHIIRSAITESPKNTPIFLSGRQSYFSSFEEMRQCLGARDFAHVSLQDLHESEVKALFRKINPKINDPVLMEWLPQRPLLLAYIYFELGPTISADEELLTPLSPGNGWNILLDRLCARETNVAKGAEPGQIRRLLERIALFARTNISDPGRITSLHVADAYRDVMLMEPDISVQQVLMRFPGLTTGHANEERSFIDNTIFEAAQAGTLVEAIIALASKSEAFLRSDPVVRLLGPFSKTRSSISPLTAQVVVSSLRKENRLGLLSIAIAEVMDDKALAKGNLLADLLICASLDPNVLLRKEVKKLKITAAVVQELEITPELVADHYLEFEDCIFDVLEISVDSDLVEKVEFRRCRVKELSCSHDASKCLASIGLQEQEIESKKILDGTNSDILTMAIPDAFKVLKIVLRKLFYQAGSGRKKSAFYRGMGGIDPDLIQNCLSTLQRHGLVYVVGTPQSDASVWHPNRLHSKRASFLVDTISIPDDAVLKELLS
ncbi:NACHT domain-containing protein [Sinorhizobium fredii]|uniref:NACHT domain-containing protein n=1 Tax=Rhizobium fredii TaxID=380 RepID=UPI0004B245A2|nr:NACHT domain-containing protein [Sinorhizobium fredii]